MLPTIALLCFILISLKVFMCTLLYLPNVKKKRPFPVPVTPVPWIFPLEDLDLDVISFNACISACEKGFRWELALSLLQEIIRKKLSPTEISYLACKIYVQDMKLHFIGLLFWWFFPVRFHIFCGFFPCIEKKAGWCIVSELRLQWCDYCLWPFCTMAMCCAAAGWHGRGRLVVGSWTWRRDTIATGSREFHDVRCCLSQDGWTFISLKDDDADDDDHLWNILKQPISTSSCHFTWNPRKSLRKAFFEANKVFKQQIAAENVFRCHVFRLFSPFWPFATLFPRIMEVENGTPQDWCLFN